ncbi:MAG: DUF3786 domain-containing protein [Clostridiales bacterium]|jgi:hypothetical protein|nr:DUF3786 domain-containing protein [Clostridiales bacterium]
MMKKTSGYAQIYATLLPHLANCDIAESAARLGLEFYDGAARVNFLGREYRITHDGAFPADGPADRPADPADEPDSINNRSILLYYILSQGAGQPDYIFFQLARLTGMIAGYGQKPHSNGLTTERLVREVSGKVDLLSGALTQLGGVEQTPLPGSRSWLLHPLPKIPVKIVYYEADDEFPADIDILFDSTAPRFMAFECLAVMGGCLVSAASEIAFRA